ncbi:MAG: hypothetical protein WC306_02920 [Candidatus Paceibacterota bacterium]|jgi:hypothetical protein
MFLENLYNKLSRILLSILIFNLTFWNLFLIPAQTQAINTLGPYHCDPNTESCHSCNSEGVCVRDNSGPYSCPVCNQQCSISLPKINEAPSASSSGCGEAGPTPVYIIGSNEQSAAEAAAQEGINSLEDLANATGLADEAKQSLIDLVNQNKPIPENLKEFMISAIENSTEILDNTKETLINLINQGKAIPDSLKDTATTMIGNLTNTIDLVKNKFLDLILAGLDIEGICGQLSNAVANLPWGAGAAIATAITMTCPLLLDSLLTELGYYEERNKAGESTQTIEVPTLEYYQWEIGIPGFIKPGQIIKFK